MQIHLPQAYRFPVSLLIGMIVGYMPAVWYFEIGKAHIDIDGSFIDMSYTVVRGVITGVDTRSKILHIRAVSPYSPYESAPFNIMFEDDTLVRSTPSIPENAHSFLPSLQAQTVDTSHLVAGSPVTVRVSRESGPLRASWIAIRNPEHN